MVSGCVQPLFAPPLQSSGALFLSFKNVIIIMLGININVALTDKDSDASPSASSYIQKEKISKYLIITALLYVLFDDRVLRRASVTYTM